MLADFFRAGPSGASLAAARGRRLEDIMRVVVGAGLRAFQGRRMVRRFVLQRLVGNDQMLTRLSASMDVMTRALEEAVATCPDPVRMLSPAAWFIVVRALVAPIRAAVFCNPALMDDPAFEAELVRMAVSFLRREADPKQV